MTVTVPKARAGCSGPDGSLRIGVEELKASGVEGDPDLLSDLDPGRRVDAGPRHTPGKRR